jgi:hypothetical protein
MLDAFLSLAGPVEYHLPTSPQPNGFYVLPSFTLQVMNDNLRLLVGRRVLVDVN